MKKTVKRIAAMLVIAMLALSLTACSDEALLLLRGIVTATAPVTEVTPIGGADEPTVILLQGADETRPDPVGAWNCTNYKELLLEAMEAQGIDRAQAEEMLAAAGETGVTVIFGEDNTFTITITAAGQSMAQTGTWTAVDNGISATIDGDTQVFLWNGDKLMLPDDEDIGIGKVYLIFEKAEDAEAAAETVTPIGGADEPAVTVLQGAEKNRPDPVGVWKDTDCYDAMVVVAMGLGYSEEEAEELAAALGDAVYTVTLNPDKTGTVCFETAFNTTKENFTWTADDEAITLTGDDGSTSVMRWDGGKLLYEYEGLQLVLEKEENTVSPAPEAGEKSPVGIWEVTNLRQYMIDGLTMEGLSPEQIDIMLENMSVSAKFIIAEGGTFMLIGKDMTGDTVTRQGTWIASGTGVTLVLDGSPHDLVWDGDALVGEENGLTIRLEQPEAPECWVTDVQDNASIEIDPVGSWECVNLREAFIQDALNRGDSMEEAEAELAGLGDISARLQLFPDGTATFTTSNMYINESETGTWEPTEKGILISGMTVLDSPEFLWDGTSLTTLEESILMIFEKTESPAISYWFVSVPGAGEAGPVEPEQ